MMRAGGAIGTAFKRNYNISGEDVMGLRARCGKMGEMGIYNEEI